MIPEKNASNKLLKSLNEQKVLHLIFAEGPISRVELAHKTGLSQQTVVNIVNRLLQEGLILEGEHIPLESGSGRKRISLVVNSANFYAIGIELAGRYMRGGVYNFRYELLGTAEQRVVKYESIEQFLELLRMMMDELLASVPDLSKMKGIGISVQGLVDSRQGILQRPPGFPFQRLPLKSILEDAFGYPVYIENDANLLAVNQNMNGLLASSKDNLTFKFDFGIGGAIVSDKQLISGSTFVAGEFGHYKAFFGPDAIDCYCGGTGCMTTLASTSGLAYHTGLKFAAIKAGVRAGDEQAVRLYTRIVEAIGIGISNMVTFLNPDSVLLTGEVITTFGDAMMIELTERVLASVPATSRDIRFLHLKQLPDETEQAAGLVLKRVFEIPLDTLSL